MGHVKFGAMEVNGEFTPTIEIDFGDPIGRLDLVCTSHVVPDVDTVRKFAHMIYKALTSEQKNYVYDRNGNA